MKKVELTQEGFNNLKRELDGLIQVKRPYAIKRLHNARSMGDLKENSEYSSAKEDLAFVEGRIMEVEAMLKNAVVVKPANNNNEIVLGSTVNVEVNNQKETYQIVGEFEADPLRKKLSTTSPIGKALLGKRKNDVVEVNVPSGVIKYKIISIQ